MFDRIPVEKVQSYWDERPCNIRHSTREVGTKEYFDEVETRKYFVEPHILKFAEFERWKNKRVLEIGCGIGTSVVGFARQGAIVSAIDLSQKSLNIAQLRMEVYGFNERVSLYQGNAEELSKIVPVEPYDLIYSFGVIHHTPHPELVIQQLWNYVKPGTTIKIMVYHRLAWKVFWILITYGKGQFWRLDELIALYSEAQTGCPITYTYTRDQGRRLLEDVGLKVTKIEVEHIFPYRIADYTQYKYVKEWYFQLMPDYLFHWLESQLGWHLCLTATCL